jgi:sugar (pentulose or hexulose) kinase
VSPAAEPVLLGIDVGTTNAKAGLVALDGRLLASARASYAIDVDPERGFAEQDPEAWWQALATLVRDLAPDPGRIEIRAIAIAGHGPTLVAVDETGRPVRSAVTWLDTRALGEESELAQRTGLRGWALGVLPAALWLERTDPSAAGRARWYLNTWEALSLRLTGRAATSLVHGQAFPDRSLLAAAGLEPDRIAPAVAAGSMLGELTSEAAVTLNLPAGIPVVAGIVDAFASFHGAGLLRPGDAIDAGGTAGGFGVYVDRPVPARGSFSTPAPLPGRHVVGGAMAATGKALDWFRDDVLDGTIGTEELIAEAAAIAPGADGLLFLPYLAGERSPIWDPTATGAFVGLTVSHGRAHLARAILEAAAFAIRHVAEPILAAGVDVGEMRVCGGPARSRAWNRIKADITGFSILVPTIKETAVQGAAILGAVAIGAHADLAAAISAMVSIEDRIEPDPAHAARYDALFEVYAGLQPALDAAKATTGRPAMAGSAR